jgi:hypothetical protein
MMGKQYELTWVHSLKQWRKRRKGKTFYLGSGDYKTALQRWRLKEAELIQAEKAAETDPELEAYEKGLAALRGLGGFGSTPSDSAGKAVAKYLGWDKPATASSPKQKSFAGVMVDYLAVQKRRFLHGQKFPNAPTSERLSAGRYSAYEIQMRHLTAAAGNMPTPQKEAELYEFFKRFREAQQALLNQKKIGEHTFNDRMKLVSHFVRWMHESYIIQSMPRNFSKLISRYSTKTTARALPVELIKLLFNNSPPLLQTFIALGLNCCFYAVDIAYLQASDIQRDYIVIDRHKTGVFAKYKLWPITKGLLEENANKTGPAFNDIINFNAKQQRQCKIDNLLYALKRRLKLKRISFSNFRDTTSTIVDGIDRTLTDIVLAHKDNRMAAYYVAKRAYDGSELQDRVDKVLAKVEAIIKLGKWRTPDN